MFVFDMNEKKQFEEQQNAQEDKKLWNCFYVKAQMFQVTDHIISNNQKMN